MALLHRIDEDEQVARTVKVWDMCPLAFFTPELCAT